LKIPRTTLIYVLIVLLLSLSLVTVKSSTWIYTKTLSDNTNDNSGYPGYTDLIRVDYGYNETHFNVNITVNEAISLGEGITIYIGVLIDTDINGDTGYKYPPPNGGYIGADKLIEVSITNPNTISYVSVYNYTGDGSTWSWTLANIPADSVYCELNENSLKVIASRGVIGYEIGEIRILPIITYCQQGICTTVDYLDVGVETILPIPEPAIMVALATTSIAILMSIKVKNK